jgi:hypothetical protein
LSGFVSQVETALLTGDSDETAMRVQNLVVRSHDPLPSPPDFFLITLGSRTDLTLRLRLWLCPPPQGLGSVQVRMKPADKLAWIRAAQQGAKGKKRIVAMVGDGINDGPSLMAADVGTSLVTDHRGT